MLVAGRDAVPFDVRTLDREYIRQLALPEDLEALKLSLMGSYFAVCCFAAVCSCTWKVRTVLMNIGVTVSRSWVGTDLCSSITEDQVRVIRGSYDDRPFDHC